MRFADVIGDLPTSVYGGDVLPEGKVTVPDELDGVRAEHLRFVDGKFVDASKLAKFYVGADGVKHAVRARDDDVAVDCRIDEALVMEGGRWRARSSADDLLTYAAMARTRKENAGAIIEVGGKHIAVDTSERGKTLVNLLAGAELTLFNANPVPFKCRDGAFVMLNDQNIKELVVGIADYVRSCLALEQKAAENIRAGLITKFEQIEKIFFD